MLSSSFRKYYRIIITTALALLVIFYFFRLATVIRSFSEMDGSLLCLFFVVGIAAGTYILAELIGAIDWLLDAIARRSWVTFQPKKTFVTVLCANMLLSATYLLSFIYIFFVMMNGSFGLDLSIH